MATPPDGDFPAEMPQALAIFSTNDLCLRRIVVSPCPSCPWELPPGTPHRLQSCETEVFTSAHTNDGLVLELWDELVHYS